MDENWQERMDGGVGAGRKAREEGDCPAHFLHSPDFWDHANGSLIQKKLNT